MSSLASRFACAPAVAVALAAVSPVAHGQVDEAIVARIKMEGFQNSQVADTLFHLADVHGPRLHGSENFENAAAWSRDRLSGWGLSQAKLESWESPVPAWSASSYSVELVAPSYQRLIAYPMAWTPSLARAAVEGMPVLVMIDSADDYAKYRGTLRGKIVLKGRPQALAARDVASGRFVDEELGEMAKATDPGTPRDYFEEASEWDRSLAEDVELAHFFREEGVAAVLEPSARARGVVRVTWNGTFDANDSAPTLVLAREHYNRVARLVDRGFEPELRISLVTAFDEDVRGYNVLAELPGRDPEIGDEIVLLGAHLDSWHAGTGATDNAAGSAVMMEALRILKAIDARPRRTIRLGLWGGEEQAYWGSRHHVETHYGDLVTGERKKGHGKISAYYNLDTGTGSIRGIYLQGNEAARPILERFLAPFNYLGATTLTAQNTSGTDHLLFDAVGIPAFTFIQDPMDYETFTHHTNMDVYDYVSGPDLAQAAVVTAAVAYATAMMDEKMPRKVQSRSRR